MKSFLQIEEAEPVLRCFQNNWATEWLARETFKAHKSYDVTKAWSNTYRGKKRRIHLHEKERLKKVKYTNKENDLGSQFEEDDSEEDDDRDGNESDRSALPPLSDDDNN